MDEVYINMKEQNDWLKKYFKNRDFVSVDDLISCIEDLDYEIYKLKEKAEEEQPTTWDLEFERGFKGSNEY